MAQVKPKDSLFAQLCSSSACDDSCVPSCQQSGHVSPQMGGRLFHAIEYNHISSVWSDDMGE